MDVFLKDNSVQIWIWFGQGSILRIETESLNLCWEQSLLSNSLLNAIVWFIFKRMLVKKKKDYVQKDWNEIMYTKINLDLRMLGCIQKGGSHHKHSLWARLNLSKSVLIRSGWKFNGLNCRLNSSRKAKKCCVLMKKLLKNRYLLPCCRDVQKSVRGPNWFQTEPQKLNSVRFEIVSMNCNWFVWKTGLV